ncbi:dimethylargininase [Kitasatospora sp. NPDC002040]|uniref:dimethylargininase n=1 Tax=Kitasatospora sp. NPDC002040 TaxID=3154661 RepID=UPI00332E0E3F
MTDLLAPQTVVTQRQARIRHFLMCRPDHFDVTYSINPWMEPEKPTSNELAIAQWEQLHTLLVSLGHHVQTIDPAPGLPDMVFAANGATVVDDKALVARFRHPERDGESQHYVDWFRAQGFTEVRQAEWDNEGEGDYLTTRQGILAGNGFRSDPRSQAEAEALFGRPVIGLSLVDPRFYHLDTALAVLDEDEVMYYPEAFTPESRRLLRTLFPDAVIADEADAVVFGLNAVSDGYNVILPEAATGLAAKLRARGFRTHGVDLSELLKAGGSAKCCTLELRH